MPRIAREDVVDGVLHVTNGIERDKLGFRIATTRKNMASRIE